MKGIIFATLLLVCGTTMADETTNFMTSTQFATEHGAQIALTKIINAIAAAVPALTPEQKEYVRREEAFQLGPGRVGVGDSYGERVNAYTNSKEFRLWSVHHYLERLRTDLGGVKLLAGRPARFALWSDIVVQMSSPSALEVALTELSRMRVISKAALGQEDGVNWLLGPQEGTVQILWPFAAETMWTQWCYDGVADATGASKLLVRHVR